MFVCAAEMFKDGETVTEEAARTLPWCLQTVCVLESRQVGQRPTLVLLSSPRLLSFLAGVSSI